MNNIFYKIMEDLPKLPPDLEKIALDLILSQEMPLNANQHAVDQNPIYERVFTRNGQKVLSRSNPRFSLEDQFGDWVSKNISTEWKQIGVSNSIALKGSKHYTGDAKQSADQVPHTDLTRHYTLMYLLEKGNEDQRTVWWQEPGYGLQRKRDVIVWEPDHLEKVAEVIFPIGTWAFFNTNILHNAENVQEYRIAVHVGFEVDPFGVFMRTENDLVL